MKDYIALVQHVAWPVTAIIVFLFVFLVFKSPLVNFINSVSIVKFGDFSAQVGEAASKAGVGELFENLNVLNMDQLHLFLTVGGQGGDSLTINFRKNNRLLEKDYKRLVELNLIEFSKEGEIITFKNTDKGERLHKAIMDQLYDELVIQPSKVPTNTTAS